MSFFDFDQTAVSLTAQRQAARKTALEHMAEHFARQLKSGMTRDVAVPALQTFVATMVPAGKGQADKAKDAAERAIDAALEAIENEEA